MHAFTHFMKGSLIKGQSSYRTQFRNAVVSSVWRFVILKGFKKSHSFKGISFKALKTDFRGAKKPPPCQKLVELDSLSLHIVQ